MADTNQSLSWWRQQITTNRKAWGGFYQAFLGSKISSYPRFYQLVALYGDWPVFEAIIESSNRSLTGDVLPYVSKVAHEKWKVSQQQDDSDAAYIQSVNASKELSNKKNVALAKRIKRRGTK